MAQLPHPIDIPWTMKPLTSARTSSDRLDDGRLHLTIEHDIVHGVTPEMLVWWFNNLEGDVELAGTRHPRYRVWHPRDHVAFRYARRPGLAVGAGAVFHIHEVLGRDPRFVIDVLTDVARLDEAGFVHRPRRFGMHPVAMDYTFTRVSGGTRYTNSLTVGWQLPRGLRWLNDLLVARAFDEAHGQAWLTHNVEEVGNLEQFLPALFATPSGQLARVG